jgi:hypothetical protein|tara:strand:- start:7 stop:243 length:237 start_codon:yes stop_codon:yes gene_type:complete
MELTEIILLWQSNIDKLNLLLSNQRVFVNITFIDESDGGTEISIPMVSDDLVDALVAKRDIMVAEKASFETMLGCYGA